MGVASRRRRQRRLRRPVPHQPRTESAVPEQLRRNVHRRLERASGADDPGWSVSAAFLDYDRDGWLDLYVGNYVQLSRRDRQAVLQPDRRRDYCTPNVYRPQPDRLYHNNAATARSSDVTAKALAWRATFGPALGVVAADFNGDGWIDIYVANDGQPNQLWINQRNGTFRNTGAAGRRGVDRARQGRRRAWASTPAISTTTATTTCS